MAMKQDSELEDDVSGRKARRGAWQQKSASTTAERGPAEESFPKKSELEESSAAKLAEETAVRGTTELERSPTGTKRARRRLVEGAARPGKPPARDVRWTTGPERPAAGTRRRLLAALFLSSFNTRAYLLVLINFKKAKY